MEVTQKVKEGEQSCLHVTLRCDLIAIKFYLDIPYG